MKYRFDMMPDNSGYCWFYENRPMKLEDCIVAGKTVKEWLECRLKAFGFEYGIESRLSFNLACMPRLRDFPMIRDFIKSVEQENISSLAITDQSGNSLAWINDGGWDSELVTQLPIEGMKLLEPWCLLDFQQELLETFESEYDESRVSPKASILGVLKLGEGSTILPGVVIEGHVSIGENCRIGPNCYIRGTTSIGNNCVIGQSVEIKSSNIGDRTWISHLSYVGDSIIGNDVNFGAGSVCSNYRHDGGNHKVMLGDELYDTQRNKLGAMIGNRVKLGCHTIVYPGRIIHADCTTLPGSIVTRNLHAEDIEPQGQP